MSKIFRKDYFRGLFSIAIESLLRHRLRSLLSILGIICGVAAVFATLSVGEGAKREVMNGIRQLGLDNVIFRRTIPAGRFAREILSFSEGLQQKDSTLLLALSNIVEEVGYLKIIPAEVVGLGGQLTPLIAAVSDSYIDVYDIRVRYGRRLLSEDESRAQPVCLIGKTISTQLGARGSVGEYLRIEGQLYLIVGIIQSRHDSNSKKNGALLARDLNQMVLIPFGSHVYLTHDRNEIPGQVDEIIVRLRRKGDSEKKLLVLLRTMDIVHNNIRDYQIIVPRRLLQQARETQRIFNLVLAAIGSISLVVGGIGIMNVMLASVSERTREIGIRRAVGATPEDIMCQFLAEAIVLTATGGVLGICAGILCSWAVAIFAGWNVAVTFTAVFISLITAVAVGLCSGVYPALKAGRLDPVVALSTS